MSLLSEVQQAVNEIQGDPEINSLRFRLAGIWSDGTSNRYSVKDPNKGDGGKGFTRLSNDPIPASLRLLRLWPGDPEPAIGSVVDHQGGKLVLGLWADQSIWTGQRVGVCRLVDERAYPTVAALDDGTPLRLRIIALDAPALTTTSNDLAPAANNSHRGHLPPGVQLQVGEVITTGDGDQYQVVPPLQRDSLGDVLGLSWMGRIGTVTSTDPVTGEPTTTPTPDVKPDDRWWREGIP